MLCTRRQKETIHYRGPLVCVRLESRLICLEDGKTVEGLMESLGLPHQIPGSVIFNGIKDESKAKLQENVQFVST